MKKDTESQFEYWLLVWLFMIYRKINHLHERSLQIAYKGYTSFFGDLLRQDKSLIVHHKSIQSVVIELFKVKQNLSGSVLCNIFQTRSLV